MQKFARSRSSGVNGSPGGTAPALKSEVAAVVAFVALRIEWLNVQAGGLLPNHEYVDGNPAEGCVEWTESPFINEAAWRRSFGPRDADFQPVNRLLTPAENAQMRSDIHRQQASNSVLELLGTVGLAQYLLVPALLVMSIVVIVRDGARRGLPGLVVALAAGVLMIYRSYFSSLGW